MLLAYIDSIEPLVASAHAQMQMKQAHFFFLQFFVVKKICVGPCFLATGVVTPLAELVLILYGLPLDGWGAHMRDLKGQKMNFFKQKRIEMFYSTNQSYHWKLNQS
jgi:hypothetical protein